MINKIDFKIKNKTLNNLKKKNSTRNINNNKY